MKLKLPSLLSLDRAVVMATGGLGLLAYGAGSIYPPAAPITAGLGLIVMAVLTDLSRQRTP